MQEYVTELSKFAIPILMAVHTVCGFLSMFDRLENSRVIHVLQTMLLFSIQFLMFVDLALVTRDMQYLFFYVFVQAFLLAAAVMVPVVYDKVNCLLLDNMCLLIGVGMCVISRLSFKKAVKQYIIVLVSLAISLFIPLILSKIRFLKKLTWVYAGVGIAMLSVVLILGEVTHGSKLTFSIRGVSFQPSEFVKILYVFFSGRCALGKYLFCAGGVDCCYSRGSCGGTGDFQRSGKRIDFLCRLCIYCLCRHEELSLSFCRSSGRNGSRMGCLSAFCSCEGQGDCLEESLDLY